MSAVTAAETMKPVKSVGLPPPIRDLNEAGQMSSDELDLAETFYADVEKSGLLPLMIPELASTDSFSINSVEVGQGAEERVKGIFSLLNAIDERLLATVCALVLEMKLAGNGEPVDVEEVGRKIMGYSLPEANSAAGAALLRAALWIIRFGYENPIVYKTLLAER
ncbi:MAG: hypothetical protein ACR2PH_08890, partial [Desulfobulbia bacterium]